MPLRPGRRKRAREETERERRLLDLEEKVAAQAEKIEGLREENGTLRRKLERQATRQGETMGPTTITVGGIQVDLYPLSPADWVRGLGKLPDFFLQFVAVTMKAKPGGSGPEAQVSEEKLSEFVEEIRHLIRASLKPEDLERVDFDRLSMPEIKAAAEVVVEINGYDRELEEFFRLRGEGPRPGSGRSPVRNPS